MPKAQDASTWINPPLIKAPVGVSPRVSTLPGRRDGSRPSGPLPPEFTLIATSDSITATITESNGATSYEIRVDSGAAVSGLTVTGLNPEQIYSVQVRGTDVNGTSDWSTAVDKTTLGVSSGDEIAIEPDGSLIFAADFDNMPDWELQHARQNYVTPVDWNDSDGSSGYVAEDNIPPGFDFYYASDWWHPNGDKDGNDAVPGSHPSGQINSSVGNHLGPDGKAFVLWDESGTGGGWGSECQLMKHLENYHKELYSEFYIKFQPGFKWESIENDNGQSTYKIVRFGRWIGGETDPRSEMGSSYYSPMHFFNLQVWTHDAESNWMRIAGLVRLNGPSEYPEADAQASIRTGGKYSGNSSLSWEETFGDAEWHKINLHHKMNSAAGQADGELRVWIDDVLQYEQTDIEWNSDEAENGTGWDWISIGGNGSNEPYPVEDQVEQWWAISGYKIWNGVPV